MVCTTSHAVTISPIFYTGKLGNKNVVTEYVSSHYLPSRQHFQQPKQFGLLEILSRILFIILLSCLCYIPFQAQALSYQTPPVLDELASPFTESEAGGIGCIVASVTVGSMMVYLLGGFGAVSAAVAGPLTAARVLEGSAAAAFVFSSACYIGVATAPIIMSTYTAVVDSIDQDQYPATKPLFAPPELGGTSSSPNISTIDRATNVSHGISQ